VEKDKGNKRKQREEEERIYSVSVYGIVFE